MTDRVAVIEELHSGQVAKFYTGIKCIAYSYQALIFYMNIVILFSYGVFPGNSGFVIYNGEKINLDM